MRRFLIAALAAAFLSGVLPAAYARNVFAPTGTTGAASPFALVAHTSASSSTTGATTPAINCSTAAPNALLIINIGNQAGMIAPTTITDNATPPNTYTKFADITAGSGDENALYYSITGTVSAAMTATVTFSASSTQPSFEFACFKSNSGTIIADASNINSGATSSTTLTAGPLTPFNNNSLVIAGMGQWAGIANGTTFSINAPFTLLDQQFTGIGIGSSSALAYTLQTTAVLANPTWTATSPASAQTAVIAAFTTTAIPLVTHVADSHNISSSATSTITFTVTAPANGNAWVGKLIIQTTTDLITSMVAGSNTFTRVNPISCHSASFMCYGVYALGLTGAPTTVTVTLSAAPAGTFHDLILSEYSGAVAFGTSATNDSAGSGNSVNVTTTSTHNLIWSGLHDGSSVTFPSGFTTRLNDTADGDYSADFQQQSPGVIGVGWISGVASDQAVLTLVP